MTHGLRRHGLLVWIALALALAIAGEAGLIACSSFSGDSAADSPDGGVSDTAGGDAAASDGAGGDGASGDAADAAPTYSSVKDMTKWASFDLAQLNVGAGFAGSVFDGRYVYLVPYGDSPYHGHIVRYDTRALFPALKSWSSFDTTTLALVPAAKGFIGAVFDGKYVYFVPYFDGLGYRGRVLRYDTTMSFATNTSWLAFDTTTVNPAAKGFFGAAFDGQYVTFFPDTAGSGSVAARYDTKSPFSAPGSWSAFDLAGVTTGAKGYFGGAFDGHYVYAAPYYRDANYHGLVARYDTKLPFANAGTWSTFDMTTVAPRAVGFEGAAFDGRYVYFVPNANDLMPSGLVGRYDTQAPFGDATSWSTFDLVNSVDVGAKGFEGATFDGRYVYLVPQGNPYSAPAVLSGLLTRFDTQGQFGDAASWSTFDMTGLSPAAKGFGGAAFDGEYVYFVPRHGAGTVITRFDAKTPPSLPKRGGSFY